MVSWRGRWPEQAARAERLSVALQLAAELKPEIVQGDGPALLPDAVAAMPPDGRPCIFHSFTLNQFSAAARGFFRDTLREIGRARPLFEIGLEWVDAAAPELAVTRYDAAGDQGTHLANCDAHGAWIEWLHPSYADSGIDRKQPEP